MRCFYQLALSLLLSSFLVSGCLGNSGLSSSGMADNNVNNLSRISLGMSEAEVFQIMRQPYSQEALQVGDDQYKVWFYVTRVTVLGQTRMVPLNLTPITFKNGILSGWGYNSYRHVIYLRDLQTKMNSAPQIEKKPAEENLQLEKVLETPPPSAPAPSPNNSKTTSSNEGQGLFSMSKKPKKEDEPPEKSSPLDEKDEKMLEEENEQNFDYW